MNLQVIFEYMFSRYCVANGVEWNKAREISLDVLKDMVDKQITYDAVVKAMDLLDTKIQQAK